MLPRTQNPWHLSTSQFKYSKVDQKSSSSFEIPKDYADFADVFDKIAADSLPEHRSYNLKIDLEDALGHLYPLSKKELKAL